MNLVEVGEYRVHSKGKMGVGAVRKTSPKTIYTARTYLSMYCRTSILTDQPIIILTSLLIPSFTQVFLYLTVPLLEMHIHLISLIRTL